MGNAGEVGGNPAWVQASYCGGCGRVEGKMERGKHPGSLQMGARVAGACSPQGRGRADMEANPFQDCIPHTLVLPRARARARACLCVCVCVCARARVRVCV